MYREVREEITPCKQRDWGWSATDTVKECLKAPAIGEGKAGPSREYSSANDFGPNCVLLAS